MEDKKNLVLDGLMTIGSSREGEFAAMNEMRRVVEGRLQRKLQLSMGMSHDWGMAVRHGASQVRIGTLIFGDRPANKHLDTS